MKRKAFTLIFSLCTAAALCAAAVIVSASAGGNDNSNSSTISANTISGTVTAIKYENAGQTPVELLLDGENWTLAENKAFPLNQSAAAAMLNNCKDVSATRYVGESSNFAEYGLDEPQLLITLTEGANTVIYKIGSKNSHTGDYYFAVDGKDSVYTVGYSFVSAFSNTVEQMAVIEQPPALSPSEVNSVEILQSSGTHKLNGENVQDTSSQSTASSSQETRKYTLSVNGTSKEIEADKAESFLYSINSLSFTSCAAFMPQNLEEYGLSAPNAKAIVTYTKQTTDESETASTQKSYTLLFGGGSPDGSRYAMLDGTNMVCLIDASSVSEILTEFAE